jgi:hypothetical protein
LSIDLGGGETTKSEENADNGEKKKNSNRISPNFFFPMN